jgi:uncharacterized cupredoxin-like copper-binding protein
MGIHRQERRSAFLTFDSIFPLEIRRLKFIDFAIQTRVYGCFFRYKPDYNDAVNIRFTIHLEEIVSKRLVFLIGGLFVLLIAACGGSAPGPVTYDIDMTEYAFTPANLEFKVGQEVTLNLTNSGQLQHEVMFGRQVMMMNNRPAGYTEDMFEVGGVVPEVQQVGEPEEEEEEMHEGFMVAIPKSGTGTIKFTVTKDMVGDWEMGCFEQAGVHYDAGMKGTVTVTQ